MGGRPFNPDRPGARKLIRINGKDKYIYKVIAEVLIGRPLRKGEVVHHKDEDHHNNDPDNLEVITQSAHIKLHHAKMAAAHKRAKGVPDCLVCPACDEEFELSQSQRTDYYVKGQRRFFCSRECYHDYQRTKGK